MLIAAPLAAYIPLAALAGVLAVVAWNMIEKPAIAILLRSGWGEATVLGATFFLTIFRDLTEAIVVGFALGSVLFIQRMSQTTQVAAHTPIVGHDEADMAVLGPPMTRIRPPTPTSWSTASLARSSVSVVLFPPFC